jgi:eukaryotic-like serine/threonine-protein kinase
LAIQCPKCQTENPKTARFCLDCGTPLTRGHEPNSQEFGIVSPELPTKTLQVLIQELTTGSTFAGRYQVIEELGRGGMGKVYKVFDTKIKDKVALKLIKPEISSDSETIERFSNELRLARKIAQRNVCKMFDLGEAEGAHFITMEYVQGEDLKSMIRMAAGLSIGAVLSIGKQICDGLAEAHALGVVHRDLKPQNIMIDKGGNAKIMDFGIARSMREKGITGPSVLIGTPEYMSPEQAEAKEVDQRSDIYSLGIILYEMATGHVPFEGDTPLSIAMKHKGEAPKNPKQFNPHIPDDLAGVILKCLEKDRSQRYQTASDVRAELERIEKGLPTAERVAPERKPFTSKQITVSFPLKKLIIPVAAILTLAVIGIALIKFLPKKAALPPAPPQRSIAVLPFENYSDSKEDEYFSDGITEDITTQLSKISELQVCSRTSAMMYKKTTKGIREIGKELGVAAVLEGSVRRAANAVRITAQLIDSNTDKQIWAETYDREFKEIFTIQSDIAQQIAAALKATLTPAEKERIEKKPTKDIRAYEYYVKGREYYYRYRKDDNEQALELFKKALEVDPNYALAHAGLADAYSQRVIRFGFPEEEWSDKIIEQAQKAISLDPSLAEGYKSLGSAYFYLKGWWTNAAEVAKKAVEANPNSELACGFLVECYLARGDLDKAFPLAKKTIALNPASGFPYTYLAGIYVDLDEPAQAEVWLNKALEIQPDLDVVHARLIDFYLASGQYDKAFEQSQAFLSKVPDDPPVWMVGNAALAELFSGHYEKAQAYYRKIGGKPIELGYIYWKAGRKDEARELFQTNLDRLQKRLEQGDENNETKLDMAAIYAVQGDKEEALRWLEKAADAGWNDYNYASRYPLFENIRDDEQFKRIMGNLKARVAEMRRRIEQLERNSSK